LSELRLSFLVREVKQRHVDRPVFVRGPQIHHQLDRVNFFRLGFLLLLLGLDLNFCDLIGVKMVLSKAFKIS